ncbi:MAG: hypothetical protein HFH54_13965 [Lachnospiraceae bacterium]|nr:hypothetical protein [Lachnospiraceae bacterium]
MMGLQDFMEKVSAEVKKRLGKEYRVERKNIPKNNNVTAHAVIIRKQDDGIAPCIYVDNLYERYLKGDADISSAVGEVMHSYREHAVGPGIDIPLFTDTGDIISKVRGRLINTEMNRCLLEDIPHRGFLDLSLVYAVGLPQYSRMDREILIHNDQLDIWGIDEAGLYEAAYKKIDDPGTVSLKKMDEVLGPWMGEDADMRGAGCSMYVLTNKGGHTGAVQLLNKNALDSAADHIGTDSLIILPSSVHELIILPADKEEEDPGYLKDLVEIVRTVNDTDVLEQEILSYHVYRYSRETGEVTIAA